jgi:WD40 repeat protein
VTANRDGVARAWSLPRAAIITDAATAAFSPDGARVIAVSAHNEVRLVDPASGRSVAPLLEQVARVTRVVPSPDGARMLTIDFRSAQLWNARSGAAVGQALAHAAEIYDAVFSSDSALVVTASEDGTAQIWDAATGAPRGPRLLQEDGIRAVAVSPKGDLVATAGRDSTARLWTLPSGSPRGAPWPHPREVSSVAFAPDGKRVVTGCYDGKARVFDVATGALALSPLELPEVTIGPMFAAYSPDGGRLLLAARERVAIVDATSGALLTPILGAASNIWGAAFSPDGERVLVPEAVTGVVRLWDARVDRGGLDAWTALARCSPFQLRGGALVDRDDALPSLLACTPASLLACTPAAR